MSWVTEKKSRSKVNAGAWPADARAVPPRPKVPGFDATPAGLAPGFRRTCCTGKMGRLAETCWPDTLRLAPSPKLSSVPVSDLAGVAAPDVMEIIRLLGDCERGIDVPNAV